MLKRLLILAVLFGVITSAAVAVQAGIVQNCNFLLVASQTHNLTSDCGDVKKDGALNVLDVTFLISYLYKGGPAPENWFNADVDHSGSVNILDLTRFINFLYKGGNNLTCGGAGDLFPVKLNSWWRYERYDSLLGKYDTIAITALDSNRLLYDLNNEIMTYDVEFRGDTVDLMRDGIGIWERYIFPLNAGAQWQFPDGWGYKTYLVEGFDGVTTPAGTFANAVRITSGWICGDECAGSGKNWFVPEVGTVMRTINEFDYMDGWFTHEVWTLIAYHIEP